uniref:Uncharacterized protein n=1 Tax=Solanum tuberosum TaxID=4113 RepID=M1DR87_SOLTU
MISPKVPVCKDFKGENQVGDRKGAVGVSLNGSAMQCWIAQKSVGQVEIGEQKVQSAHRRRGRRAQLGPHWTQDTFKRESVKICEGCGLNLRRWVESRHIGSFGELGRARQTTRRFAEVPHIAFNFMINVKFSSVTFGEKPEVVECTRPRPKVANRNMPP